jgi:hypothetical protein
MDIVFVLLNVNIQLNQTQHIFWCLPSSWLIYLLGSYCINNRRESACFFNPTLHSILAYHLNLL